MSMKEKRKDNLKYLMEQHPEIYKSYEEFGHALHEKGGPLDNKTRWLIKIAVSAASQFDFALQTHIEKALKAGCTAEEIEHTLLLTAPSAGFPRMMSALMIFRETLDS
ncbi:MULTISPECIES: carboxymuconolactone decarboxylase family protein [unclassified Oceanispirochaeta]|uniref:carboxymuconolactone decarboxylase family protein n=1 Tax=unclassified Oceanispirochaeta TaxID=2635722 RepID=UPI000E08DF92|nr:MULTISPECIES: carboxymuconolactone decarboxylase family protein [unclassified Oceanispirochaeta]MBF9014250.1 carboxymuconolactone decarboxylase family protein [Oceanispirochaeta sp. M2]NPD71136.1 carboxymuconolactone decarboxylase family protein [Oceanispirochaeta sp. M1]RDG33530.1 carboxymuconolactone decarboxylase family protein [Oceanispirochaeta sp. M1]